MKENDPNSISHNPSKFWVGSDSENASSSPYSLVFHDNIINIPSKHLIPTVIFTVHV